MPLPAPAELLAAFSRLMDERRWRWYVFGAQAVMAYGRPRLTADVDITIEPKGAAPSDVIAAIGGSTLVSKFERLFRAASRAERPRRSLR